MIPVGQEAPPFSGTTDKGAPFSLAELKGRPVVLFFYPKAGSAGCSLEARGFALQYGPLRDAGVEVVGVSVDSVAKEAQFSQECDLPFPLVADPSGTIARSYGVLGLFGVARRVTFFVGGDGRIEEIVEGTLPGRHVRRTLERFHLPTAGAPGAEA